MQPYIVCMKRYFGFIELEFGISVASTIYECHLWISARAHRAEPGLGIEVTSQCNSVIYRLKC